MITPEQLKEIIVNDVKGLQSLQNHREKLPLIDSLGRILSVDICSSINVPFDNVSAMDGYAMTLESDEMPAQSHFECVGVSIAGKPFYGEIKQGQCIRIMTGAVVPDCVNTVIMQEHTEKNDNGIVLTKSVKKGSNIRHKGEEVKTGDVVLERGYKICETDIPLLASLGICEVEVYKKIRVGVFSTGDELRTCGETLSSGQIYDSNRITIKAMLASCPVEINDYGIIVDDFEKILQTLEKASSENDFIVTSGGVSVGDYDFLKDAVSKLGEIIQYKVALKPGKPFVYGKINNARYFGLPGNPLSTAFSVKLFLIPAIYQVFSEQIDQNKRLEFTGILQNAITRKAGRAELLRGIATLADDKKWYVTTAQKQDSHRVKQLSSANVLVFLTACQDKLQAGDEVTLLPLNGKFL